MKVNYVLILLILAFAVAFCTKESSKNNQIVNEKKLIIEEVSIDIDSSSLSIYNLFASNIKPDGSELLVAYNDKLHTLDLIDITNNKVSNIKLLKEGSNSVLPFIKDLYIHNQDSIWLFNNNTFYLVDSSGNVTWKHMIPPNDIDGHIITNSNYSISNIKIFYNSIKKSLFFTTIENKDFYSNELVMSNLKVRKYKLERNKLLYDNATQYGWKQLPNVTYTKNKIIYNYPIESKIYTLDIVTGAKNIYESKSKYSTNVSDKLKGVESYESMERHKVENIHFFEVLFNEQLNCYFRIHLDMGEYDAKTYISTLYQKKDIYLMVFDKDFNIVSENKLDENKYYYFNGWGMSKNGLVIFHRESTTTDSTDEKMKFDIITF